MAKHIWKQIEIEYQGETYTVRPTLDFINHLEQTQGNSLSMLFYRASKGDLPSGSACEIIARTINYADPEMGITAEDVFFETGGVGVTLVQLVMAIITACMPEPKNPAKKKPVASKGTKKRTGQNSTE